MRGVDVLRVQEALRANGFDTAPDENDGHFTEVVVRQFQGKKQPRPDGIVGPAIRTALGL